MLEVLNNGYAKFLNSTAYEYLSYYGNLTANKTAECVQNAWQVDYKSHMIDLRDKVQTAVSYTWEDLIVPNSSSIAIVGCAVLCGRCVVLSLTGSSWSHGFAGVGLGVVSHVFSKEDNFKLFWIPMTVVICLALRNLKKSKDQEIQTKNAVLEKKESEINDGKSAQELAAAENIRLEAVISQLKDLNPKNKTQEPKEASKQPPKEK